MAVGRGSRWRGAAIAAVESRLRQRNDCCPRVACERASIVDLQPVDAAAAPRLVDYPAKRSQASLPDAEPPEDLAQQVVGRDGAGDASELDLREPELFGEQVESPVAFVRVLASRREMDRGGA